MFARAAFGDVVFLVVSGAVGVGDQEAFALRGLLIEEGGFIGDEIAVGVGVGGEDCSADEGVFSMAFDVLLDGDDVVSQLLEGEVV